MTLPRMALLTCLLQVITFSAYADDPLPGLWSVTVNMTAAGTDSGIGPVNRTHCLTQADAQNPAKLFAEMGGGCTFGEKNYQDSRFTFSVQCSGLVPMQGEGQVSFGATSFEGNVAIRAEVPEMGQLKTESRVTGSRLGDCP